MMTAFARFSKQALSSKWLKRIIWCSKVQQEACSQALTRFHYKLLILGSFIYAFTAMNVLLIAAVLTPIISEFRLVDQPLVSGLLLSAGYVGMFVGALTCGILADRLGRRKTLLLTLSMMTAFTALNAVAPDPLTMGILRFFAGIGLGGSLPQPGVYISEYVPAKYRGFLAWWRPRGFTARYFRWLFPLCFFQCLAGA
jgi:MFS family permease